jgi:hypothetical protein
LNDLIAAGDVADGSRVITGRPVTVAAAFAGELPYLMPAAGRAVRPEAAAGNNGEGLFQPDLG